MSDESTLNDAKGRSLQIADVNVLQQAKLLRAIGPAQASNQPYWQLVLCAAMVTHIDGMRVPNMPVNERQIDAMLERVGDDGIAAVQVYLTRKFRAAIEAAEAAAEQVDPVSAEAISTACPLVPSDPSLSSPPSTNASP